MTISQPPPPKKTLPACYVSILLVDNNDFTDLLKLMAVNLLKVSTKNAIKFWYISVTFGEIGKIYGIGMIFQ